MTQPLVKPLTASLLLALCLGLPGCERPASAHSPADAPRKETVRAPSSAPTPARETSWVPPSPEQLRAWLPLVPWEPTPDPVKGQVWYVAVDGTDTGTGSAEQPFATVGRALAEAAGRGGLIRIGPGVFNENLRMEQGGTEDNPLILEGTRGEDGERLTTLAAGQAVDPATWEEAFDIGPNVYRNTTFPYEPSLLTVDGLYVAHIHRDNWTRRGGGTMDDDRPWRSSHANGKALAMLAWPEGQTVHTYSQAGSEVPFMETLGAVYAHHPDPAAGVTYLRLSGGRNPRDHEIFISPGGAVVHIEQASHVHLRGLNIERGELGVHIEGVRAQHNLIDDCRIRHGRIRVLVSHKATHTTVKNSHIEIGFFGTRPGAWGGGDPEGARKAYVYDFFKRLAGSGSGSDDRAVRVQNGAINTLVQDNHLDGGLVAVTSTSNTGLIVRGNLINDFSSVGLSIITGSVDARFHDNIIYNCNKNIRLHRLNQSNGHHVYIYRNQLFQPHGFGDHIYTHAMTEEQLERMGIEDYEEPAIVIYQNTFLGGKRFFVITSRMREGLPNVRFLNNIVATEEVFYRAVDDSPIGVFDYNWIVDGEAYRDLAWFGTHNITTPAKLVTEGLPMPAWHLVPDSPARAAGIDLSKPFSIGKITYPPLPGMSPGYFSGRAPDIGAVQAGSSGGH